MELISNQKKHEKQIFQDTRPLFMRLCEDLALVTASHGIDIMATNSSGVDKFTYSSIDQQIEALDSLKNYLGQLNEFSAQKIDLRKDSRKHAWSFLSSMGFAPSQDLFDQIAPTDIIEIYDASSIQIFRSFELFDHISYSFSELFSFTWMDLFERDSFVEQRMREASEIVLSGKVKGVYHTGIPDHVVSEKFSSSKHWIKMKHKLMSPLLRRTDGSIAGFLSTFEIVDHGSNESKS